MSHNDSSFFKTMSMVLGALVAFTLAIGVLANVFSPKSDKQADPLVQQELAEQIAPVGKVRVAEAPAPVAQTPAQDSNVSDEAPAVVATSPAVDTDSTQTAQPAQDTSSEPVALVATPPAAQTEPALADLAMSDVPVRVKAVVATNCAGCHQDGLHGAARNDDAAAWSALNAKGLDVLTASVINGKGAMLPRAATSLSDDEISLAVGYMITQATAGSATGSANESTGESESVVPAPGESAQPASVEGAEVTGSAEATTQAAEAETAPAAVATAVELSASVKSVVDTLCASCHISGVSNAPKLGDKAAWDARMSAGMDSVLAAAIAGKGAMPGRGGSTLSDAELRLAIEYMANQ